MLFKDTILEGAFFLAEPVPKRSNIVALLKKLLIFWRLKVFARLKSGFYLMAFVSGWNLAGHW